MKKLLIIVLVMNCAVLLYGQGDLNEQQKVFFRNEKSFAILLNSNGIGLSYRDGKRIDYLNKKFFEIEAGTIKDPKEYKISNPYSQTGSFVFGKMNSTFYLRGSLGRQHEIYKKADLGGIAIRYFYSAGPVLALYKPIYYRVLYQNPNNPNEIQIRDEKIDESFSLPQDIYSKASFFKGIKETKVMPGLFTKAGFNFEYSKEDKVIHAIELGGQINAFPKDIPIMAGGKKKAIFFSLFVSYRFGFIVDPLHPDSNKISNFMKRKKDQ